MKQYIQIEFQGISSELSEILIAQLVSIGFEGFQEEANCLKAFIPAKDYNEESTKEIAFNSQVSFTMSVIEETNWNEVWESNFEPVIVDDFVGLRADFHKPISGVEYEIIITPKMSFGTGHHATTFMMIQQMKEINFLGKKVFDFGTGTGILAILAAKQGATEILAVDNDDWSIENAIENFIRNDCSQIKINKADTALTNKSFDVILANINKNIILENLPILIRQLNTGGYLIISGLLAQDETDILEALNIFTGIRVKKIERNNWLSFRINKLTDYKD